MRDGGDVARAGLLARDALNTTTAADRATTTVTHGDDDDVRPGDARRRATALAAATVAAAWNTLAVGDTNSRGSWRLLWCVIVPEAWNALALGARARDTEESERYGGDSLVVK